MDQSIPFKRKRGRPAVNGTTVGVRLTPDELATLDLWREINLADAGRPEAIRELMRRGYRP